MKKLPHFTYHLSNPSHKHFGWIMADGERIYRIWDAGEFYRVLGYTYEMARSGIAPEEFIWLHYTKDNCLKTPKCIQARIIDYLQDKLGAIKKVVTKWHHHGGGGCKFSDERNLEECAGCVMLPITFGKTTGQ